MDFFELLEVDREKLPRHTAEAADKCEEQWEECGRPTNPQRLARFLSDALRSCTEEGLRYPKVLLLRLKQLQRGEWP
ncbi:MAG: hypothetical protein LAP13_01835 [Acidobacteriia bacterium]|nr:hypothetical protein [Terriglobia bacterium]